VLPVLTMPGGDITHPVPDLTGYITEGQVIFSAQMHLHNIYPPVDALSSLSRLMRRGAGAGRTRDDHLPVAAQLLASLARARQVSALAELIGRDALTAIDRSYLLFEDDFAAQLVNQRHDAARPLDETLNRAWEVLARLPRSELSMLPSGMLEAHRPDGVGGL